MTLKTQMAADAAVFLNDDEFGEAIVYRKATGAERSIVALVERSPNRLTDEGRQQRPYFEVTVADDSAAGIGLDELETSTDVLEIPKRLGGAAEDMRVARVLRQDDGLYTMEVR